MSIFVRIWLAFAGVLILGGLLFFTSLERHVRPTAQQVVEDTLIDTSRLLAALSAKPLATYNRNQSQSLNELERVLDAAFSNHDNLPIWNDHKRGLSLHIYLTNDKGEVLYDSRGLAVGQDYSRWNDVYLTLKGRYGVRTTRQDPSDEASSVMYVAAPVTFEGKTIGVLSAGKPSASLAPYLDSTYSSMLQNALWVGLIALIMAALVALWLRRSIDLVSSYAQSLGAQNKKPYFFLGSELNTLTGNIETMRDALENKAYVTRYVHTLTHELKSPITAIQASGELLSDELPAADRAHFAGIIEAQCGKMESLVERLLMLAKLEQPNFRLQKTSIHLSELVDELLTLNASSINQQQIKLTQHTAADAVVVADKFWLTQAVQNALTNAINFSDGAIDIRIKQAAKQNAEQNAERVTLCIINTGQHIPDFALNKVFDRYFSIPKDANTSKGTGLGLTLVKEVMDKHGGQVTLNNTTLHGKPAVSLALHLPV